MIELMMKTTKVHIKDDPIKINQTLDFTAVDSQGLQLVKLSDIKAKYKIISSVPSLDTNTCAMETARFNQYAATNLAAFTIITISKDLPFAQARFCSSLKMKPNFYVWSDYRNDLPNFAKQTNLIIAENQLLARCLMVLDANNKILYQQIVSQVANEPDYQAVIDFTKTLL